MSAPARDLPFLRHTADTLTVQFHEDDVTTSGTDNTHTEATNGSVSELAATVDRYGVPPLTETAGCRDRHGTNGTRGSASQRSRSDGSRSAVAERQEAGEVSGSRPPKPKAAPNSKRPSSSPAPQPKKKQLLARPSPSPSPSQDSARASARPPTRSKRGLAPESSVARAVRARQSVVRPDTNVWRASKTTDRMNPPEKRVSKTH